MEQETLHDLAAPYALHALEEEPTRAFEAHLGICPRCREEVASFRDTAAALAYGAEGPEPPASLESRILDAARAERQKVTALRPRWVVPAAAAAVAAIAALAIWGTSLDRSLSHQQSARSRDGRILAILSDEKAQRISIPGANAALVVSPTRNAVLVASGLEPAPAGQTYEAWVVTGKRAEPAGTFHGGAGRTFTLLKRPVPAKALVGVTLEKAGGVDKPTGAMLIRAVVRTA
jgi:anti-sigma-K factor RskA